jgi:hypothetical protein
MATKCPRCEKTRDVVRHRDSKLVCCQACRELFEPENTDKVSRRKFFSGVAQNAIGTVVGGAVLAEITSLWKPKVPARATKLGFSFGPATINGAASIVLAKLSVDTGVLRV